MCDSWQVGLNCICIIITKHNLVSNSSKHRCDFHLITELYYINTLYYVLINSEACILFYLRSIKFGFNTFFKKLKNFKYEYLNILIS